MMENEKPFTETMKFNRWRTSMGYLYMAVCAFDFICFPILYSIFQYFSGVTQPEQWYPITLHGAGLYHVAMGAILGISAFTKSKEVIHRRNLGIGDSEIEKYYDDDSFSEHAKNKNNKYRFRRKGDRDSSSDCNGEES
jgi:hypothetical protein